MIGDLNFNNNVWGCCIYFAIVISWTSTASDFTTEALVSNNNYLTTTDLSSVTHKRETLNCSFGYLNFYCTHMNICFVITSDSDI